MRAIGEAGDDTIPVQRGESLEVSVCREDEISVARRAALALAGEIGLARAAAYSVGISASELACNLFYHASYGGCIIITRLSRGDRLGIEIAAEDSGPGIADVELAMQDGFSSSGGLGGGLPGVQRLMDEFLIESAPGSGTRVVARKWVR